jgi:hypothetical protein
MQLPADQCLRIMSVLASPALVQLVTVSYVSATSANYGCRVLALGLLQEMLSALRSGALALGEKVRGWARAQSCIGCCRLGGVWGLGRGQREGRGSHASGIALFA